MSFCILNSNAKKYSIENVRKEVYSRKICCLKTEKN